MSHSHFAKQIEMPTAFDYYYNQQNADAEYIASILAYSPLVFYDASISDVWQDSAGTTPAVAEGDVVGRWDDLSGNGYHLTQATTTNKPTLRLGVQNGQPVIRFNTDDRLINNAVAQAQPTTIFTVHAWTDNTTGRYVYDNASGGTGRHAMFSQPGTSNIGIFAGSGFATDSETLDTNFNLWVARFNGASSAIYKNGGAAKTGNAGTNGISRRVLGDNQSQNQGLIGDICTDIAFSSALSDVDRAAIRDIINSRWGVY